MNTATPLVSVVVPAYNAVNEIERCLRSVFAQTHQNLEVIVCDDCSTDGTYEKLKWLEKCHPALKVLRHEKNRGPGFARQTACETAKGDFIAYLDADDERGPNSIKKQVEALSDSSIDAVSTPMTVVSGCEETPVESVYSEKKYVSRNCIVGGSLMHRPCFLATCKWDETLDWGFTMQLHGAGARFKVVGDCSDYRYHQKPTSLHLSRSRKSYFILVRNIFVKHGQWMGTYQKLAIKWLSFMIWMIDVAENICWKAEVLGLQLLSALFFRGR